MKTEIFQICFSTALEVLRYFMLSEYQRQFLHGKTQRLLVNSPRGEEPDKF